MGARVLLVAWKGSSATAWVELLQSGGHTVLLEDTTGERAWRTAKERGIDVVIIDGEKKPSHGRQTGHALRDTAKTRNIPIIWTNLEQEDTTAVQTEVRPDVTLMAPTDAVGTLAALDTLGQKMRWENGALFDGLNDGSANGVTLLEVAIKHVANGASHVVHANGVAPLPHVHQHTAANGVRAPRLKVAKKTAVRKTAARKVTRRVERPAGRSRQRPQAKAARPERR
jgi:CheY-like chemotaxis protein